MCVRATDDGAFQSSQRALVWTQLKRRWKADGEAEASRRISQAAGIKREGSSRLLLPVVQAPVESAAASDTTAKEDDDSDVKLRAALSMSDLSFLHSHECFVDKSTLQDKSDLYQVRVPAYVVHSPRLLSPNAVSVGARDREDG